MPDADELPPHRLTHRQAAVILGVREQTVSKWVSKGRLPSVGRWAKANVLRVDVERLAAARWRPGEPSWLTATQVAAVLGVSVPRVSQLANAGRLPYELAGDGRRLFRPAQVAVIARARRVRFHSDSDPRADRHRG